CDNRANGYVGDNWRAGRIRLAVAVPSGPGWAAGSRWYRCDLIRDARAEAITLVEEDPELARHPALAASVAALVDADRAEYLEKG
ncbi:septum formation family protein, partial [Micromonospora craterilacus]|uniref:septum formation family protein n=1 Tax=Micromonospora craterilacus TaxID=1655439 RepID=UPI001F334A56